MLSPVSLNLPVSLFLLSESDFSPQFRFLSYMFHPFPSKLIPLIFPFMEFDKQNKRLVIGDAQLRDTGRLKKLKKQERGAAKSAALDAAEGVASPADDDEVEECFAILKRMKEAVRYFDERGRGREVLEQAEIVVGDDAGGGEAAKNSEEERDKKGWDLNVAAPEAAESGGA